MSIKTGFFQQVNALEITPDRNLLAAASHSHIRMYEINSNNPNPVINYEGITKNVTAVGFQEEGKWMFSGGEDCTSRIWDLRARNLQCQRMFQANHAINTVKLHPNQANLFIGDQNGILYIWDMRNDQQEQVQVDHDISIQHLDIDPDGNHLAVVDNKGQCYIYGLKNGNRKCSMQKRLKLATHKRYALKCKFSPDSTMLVTTSADQTAKVWRSADLMSFIEVGDSQQNGNVWPKPETFPPCTVLKDSNQRWVWDVAFSADSQFVITGKNF